MQAKSKAGGADGPTSPPPHAGWPQLIPSLKVPRLGLGPPLSIEALPSWHQPGKPPPERVGKYFIGSLWLWAGGSSLPPKVRTPGPGGWSSYTSGGKETSVQICCNPLYPTPRSTSQLCEAGKNGNKI